MWSQYSKLMAGKDVSTPMKVRAAVMESYAWFASPEGLEAVRKAIENWPKRLKACVLAEGGHFECSL